MKGTILTLAALLTACSPDASEAKSDNIATNVAAMAAPGVTKATPKVKKSTGLKRYQRELAEAAWVTANSNCRGGTGDDTYVWCNVRALLDQQVLMPNNRCWGSFAQATADATWGGCSAESRAVKMADVWYEEGGPAYSAPALNRAYLISRTHRNDLKLASFKGSRCTAKDVAYWDVKDTMASLDGSFLGTDGSDDYAVVLPWTQRFFVIAYWVEPEDADRSEEFTVGFNLVERCS